MRYSFVSAAILAFAASTRAQFFDSISAPTKDQTIPAGQPFDIVWAPEGVTGTITIQLMEGSTNVTLNAGPIIKSGVDNTLGKYTWNVPTDVGTFATYGILITLDGSSQSEYSAPFHISGGSSASATGGSTTTQQLSTGPSYTSSVTSSVISSVSSSGVVGVVTSTTANVTSTASTSATTAASASSNITLSSTLTAAKSTGSATKTSSGASSTSSASTKISSAAVANLANAGIAVLGGFVLALAL